jgi:hypothetical protein
MSAYLVHPKAIDRVVAWEARRGAIAGGLRRLQGPLVVNRSNLRGRTWSGTRTHPRWLNRLPIFS